ncbi:MAG: hemerythrin domain-containing protein [Acidimicrobiia bacterium]|nr:hemerythrin domain-containing protein [Acidimicrobiia bacterium]
MPVIYDSILEHHNELRSLMREMTSIKLDPDVRNKAFKDFADELAAHSGAEERFLYAPAYMHDEALSKARHGAGEHSDAEELIEKIKKLDPKGEAFLENVKELSKEVHHHMNEEEKEFFKISKKVLSDAEAKKLNDEYLIDFNRLLEKKSK